MTHIAWRIRKTRHHRSHGNTAKIVVGSRHYGLPRPVMRVVENIGYRKNSGCGDFRPLQYGCQFFQFDTARTLSGETIDRSEARCVGKEWVSRWRARW